MLHFTHLLPCLLISLTLPPTDPHIVWSPGNTCVVADTVTVSQNSTYFKAGFSGSSFALSIDVGAYHRNSIAAWSWGQWVVSVDGGAPVPVHVPEPADKGDITTVLLAHDLAKGAHNLEAWFDLRDESDTFTPKDAQTIKAILLDDGATLAAPVGAYAAAPDSMMIMGDSITKGYRSADPSRASDSANYPLTTYAATLGRALNCECGIVGLSGQGWINTYTPWNELFPIAFGNCSRDHPRVWPKGLKYLVVAEGTNDGGGDITPAVQGWLPKAREAVGAGTWIVLVVPFNGSHVTQIEAAAAAYHTSSNDMKVTVVEPSSVLSTSNNGTFYTVDGTHPQPLLQPLYGAILAGEILQNTSH